MKITFVLWLLTSNYAQVMGTYPNMERCAYVAIMFKYQLDKSPRKAFMYELACIPTAEWEVKGQEGT